MALNTAAAELLSRLNQINKKVAFFSDLLEDLQNHPPPPPPFPF